MKTFLIQQVDQTFESKPRAVALGLFDGIHLAHRAVISLTGGSPRLTPSVFTFTQPAWKIKRAGAVQIMSPEQKAATLLSLGVQELFEADYESLRHLSPEAFVRDVLKTMLSAEVVCCGFNFHFGEYGAGDADLLVKLCRKYGIKALVAPEMQCDGETISSTRVRELIEQGEMEKAVKMMGRPFTLDFTVVSGQKLGRQLGTPTINQPLPEHFVRPKFGVYCSSVIVDGKVYAGVTNVGMRPTVGADCPLAETWIPGFSGDLYGRQIPVTLVKFMRPEKKFPSISELQSAILQDEKKILLTINGDERHDVRALLFDFDDTLHARIGALTRFCKDFIQSKFPQLSADEQSLRVRQMCERNHGGYVNYYEYLAGLVELWDWRDAPPIEQLYAEFQLMFPNYVRLLPETEPVLQELHRRGYKLGILTNGPIVMQNRKLDVTGVRRLVDGCVVSGEEKIHKPDPEVFRRAASRLAVPCQNCVYVGDHPVNDIQGAQSAGMTPVYINFVGNKAHPDGVREILSLTELLEIYP